MSTFPYAIPGNTAQWKLPAAAGGFLMRGHSRAGERTGFMLMKAGVCFDAGMSCWAVPKYILVSHSHTDHSFALPMMTTAQPKKPKVYAPAPAIPFLHQHVLGTIQLNDCSTAIQAVDSCTFHEAEAGVPFSMPVKGRALTVTPIVCPHRVPSLGYCITELKKKLKAQYVGLPGAEIGALRKAGVEINDEVLSFPLIFVECTFWTDGLQQKGHERGHIHWDSLKPIMLANPQTQFMLIHFTLRYDEEDIEAFFRREVAENAFSNLGLWLDKGVIDFAEEAAAAQTAVDAEE